MSSADFILACEKQQAAINQQDAETMRYIPLPITVDFSPTALGQAVEMIGPSFVYDITIHPNMRYWVSYHLKTWGAETVQNPLSPYYNLHTDETLKPGEWFVTANGKSAGSPSV